MGRQLEEQVRATFEKHAGETKNGRLASAAKVREVMIQADLPDVHGDNFETVVFDHMKCAKKDHDSEIDFEDYVSYRNTVLDRLYVQKRKERMKSGSSDPSRDASEW